MSWAEMKRKCDGSHKDLEIKKIKSDSTEDRHFINFFSVPSLKSIAARNVAFGICKQTDIRDALRELTCKAVSYRYVGGTRDYNIVHDRRFDELEKSILEKVSFLPLPGILKAEVANIKTPVLLEILKWINCYPKNIEYMDSLCWTVQGTLDKVKTFEQLVKKDSAQQHITFLYEFACICCLENSIHNLWDKLPEPIQKDYEEKMHIEYWYRLLAYWTSIVKNELSGLLCKIEPFDEDNLNDCNKNIHRYMIEVAMSDGNILAVKYFWNKLTAEEINSNLAQWINVLLRKRKYSCTGYQDSNNFSDVLYFLLSQIDCSEGQKDIFKKNSEVILTSLFLDWPWQRFLLPTLRTIWFSLDGEAYMQFLLAVVDKLNQSKTTEKQLRQLWLESPINLKTYFFQSVSNDRRNSIDIIFNLLALKDVQTVKLIINDANAEEKKQIIFSTLKNNKLFEVLYAGKFCLLDTLLGEILSSDLDVHNFKEKIVLTYGNKLCYKWILLEAANWERVEKFLNWVFTSQDQIDNFKNKTLDKMEILHDLLNYRCRENFELADHFLIWSFNSEQEILLFKKNFAKSKFCSIVNNVCKGDWSDFEKFLSWCFTSNQDIDVFKPTVLEETSKIIFPQLSFRQNFEFVDKLICWCCHSADEIKQFKARFVFSNEWLTLLYQFVRNRCYNGDYNNWETARMLIRLFSPLDREIIVNLKEKIKSKFGYDDVWAFDPDHREIISIPSFPIEIKHLFHLIENPSYTIISDNGENNSSVADDQG